LLLWELGFTLVLDVGNVSGLISMVGDDLHTAIGEIDTVFSGGVVVIAVLVVGEVWAVMLISNSVVEVVVGW
jgi:hypothetical protein